jgi:hypothetical protein
MRGTQCLVWVAVILTLVLCGCQLVGPTSIGVGRDRYNSIIHSTAMEQTMSNIVRVYENEPTMFMDVSEVDATLSFGGALAGSLTNIGAEKGHPNSTAGTNAGEVRSAGGSVEYSETPTIRYLPLLGQALVAQMVTPVSVDALGLLYDSYWPAASVLDFADAYLTVDYGEFFSALDTIIELDDRSALQIAAAKTGLQMPDEPAGESRSPPERGARTPQVQPNNSLLIYLRPFRQGRPRSPTTEREHEELWAKQRVMQLWVRLLRIYTGTQPAFQPLAPAARCAAIGLAVNRDQGWFNPGELRKWDIGIRTKPEQELDEARDCLPRSIELRVIPQPRTPALTKTGKQPNAAPVNLVTGAPLMRTFSALGILKSAVQRPHPRIEFVTPERYQTIRDPASHPWNSDVGMLSYYTLLPDDEDSVDCPPAEQQKGCDNPPSGRSPDRRRFLDTTKIITDWLQRSATYQPPTDPATDEYPGDLIVYEKPGEDVLDDENVSLNRRLGLLRRYILIVVANAQPLSTYVAYADRGRWYYIAADDPVSQKNFHLLSLFMTMMAVPPATQPLSPVINVGGG